MHIHDWNALRERERERERVGDRERESLFVSYFIVVTNKMSEMCAHLHRHDIISYLRSVRS